MDNMSVKDVVLEKKLDNYGNKDDNFVASQELTVTITLSEYRKLVSSDATRSEAIKKAEDDKYERESEIKSLKAQVAELKAENYELKKELEDIKAGWVKAKTEEEY